jgi:DNA (cytosine-5)-methyltransferase 1
MGEKFTFIDLFSGIGGFKIALEKNGGKSVGFSEINKDAIEFYCKNFHESELNNFGDITKIQELPEHDLLTAGVPCQSWSIAGRNLGFSDDRGQLWNDTIYLLEKSKPKSFIFENVKGLVDPRNKESLLYILNRIKDAGYFANYYVINSHEYGVPQNRVRVYIVGFRDQEYFKKFKIRPTLTKKIKLNDVLGIDMSHEYSSEEIKEKDIFGNVIPIKSMSLSSQNGFNNYFLFNDLRNGDTTIHSWDILDTTKRQKDICYILLKNRRKSEYGKLDGNPLSLDHFKSIDPSITQEEVDRLIEIGILKEKEYSYIVNKYDDQLLSQDEKFILEYGVFNRIVVDEVKIDKRARIKKISITKTLEKLKEKNIIKCTEVRYDFKNTKISSGLFGVNRIFLPRSDIYSTLVASDTNDFVALRDLHPIDKDSYKSQFIEEIYNQGLYRKISKQESCQIQGFPRDFILPDKRSRWMKLIGNSVSVPVIDMLCKSILDTGISNYKIPLSEETDYKVLELNK